MDSAKLVIIFFFITLGILGAFIYDNIKSAYFYYYPVTVQPDKFEMSTNNISVAEFSITNRSSDPIYRVLVVIGFDNQQFKKNLFHIKSLNINESFFVETKYGKLNYDTWLYEVIDRNGTQGFFIDISRLGASEERLFKLEVIKNISSIDTSSAVHLNKFAYLRTPHSMVGRNSSNKEEEENKYYSKWIRVPNAIILKAKDKDVVLKVDLENQKYIKEKETREMYEALANLIEKNRRAGMQNN